MEEDIKQGICDNCGNDTFKVCIAKNANINGWLRAYCTKCGKEFEGKDNENKN